MRFHKLSLSVSETLNGMPCRQTVSRGGGRVSTAFVSYRETSTHNLGMAQKEHINRTVSKKLLSNLLAEQHIKNNMLSL